MKITDTMIMICQIKMRWHILLGCVVTTCDDPLCCWLWIKLNGKLNILRCQVLGQTLHKFKDHYSLFHLPPIKIFLLNSQKSGQMRQSNLPPLLHPPKVGGLLSRNLACKCSCNFTKICFPICFVFLHKICFPICFWISPGHCQDTKLDHHYMMMKPLRQSFHRLLVKTLAILCVWSQRPSFPAAVSLPLCTHTIPQSFWMPQSNMIKTDRYKKQCPVW